MKADYKIMVINPLVFVFIIVGKIFGFNLGLDFQYLREIYTHVKETQQMESLKLEQEQQESSQVRTNIRQ